MKLKLFLFLGFLLCAYSVSADALTVVHADPNSLSKISGSSLSNHIDSIQSYSADVETLTSSQSFEHYQQWCQEPFNRGRKRVSESFVNPNYALIISGGFNVNYNYPRYWNDCSAMFDMLKNLYGYQQSHIFVTIADGTSSSPDYRNPYTGECFSFPTDLDGDGIVDITAPATRSAISAAIANIAQQIQADEDLFVFTMDHGGKEGDHVYLNLWNSERLYDSEFASLLSSIPARSISVLMGQCYSGGFIDYLAADNRVIMTACTSEEESYASVDLLTDDFVNKWTYAMANGVGDLDGDTEISMYEAFQYALAHDASAIAGLEHPQYSCPSLLGELAKLTPDFPEISGEGVFCSSSTFVVDNIIPNCTYHWGYGNNDYNGMNPHLYIESSGETAVYRQGVMVEIPVDDHPSINSLSLPTVPFYGEERIYARISRGGMSYKIYKNVSIPETTTPSFVPSGRIFRNRPVSFTDTICTDVPDSELEWQISFSSGSVFTATGHTATIIPAETGTIIVTLTNNYGCNAPQSVTRSYTVYSSPIIHIQDTGETLLVSQQYDNDNGQVSICELCIYDSYGNLQKRISSTNDIVIEKSDLASGIYFFVAYDGTHSEKSTKSVVIK